MVAPSLISTPTSRVRSGVATGHLDAGYTARVALDRRTKADAYKLRYDSYLDGGFITANPSRTFADDYDDLPNSSTIVIYSQGNAIGSIRTCFLSKRGDLRSPGRDTFPEVVDGLLQTSRTSKHGFEGVELTRLVRSPAAANNQGLVFLLWRLAGQLALQRDFQVVMSCVRQNHASFYKRLKFKELTAPKAYPGLSCPMQLLAKDRDTYDEVRKSFSIIDPQPAGARSYEGFSYGELIRVQLAHPV